MKGRYVSLCLAAWLLAAGPTGCAEQSDSPTLSSATKFRQQVLTKLNELSEQAKPMVERGSAAVQKWVEDLFARAIAQGDPLPYDLVVLNEKAMVLAWRGPEVPDLKKTYQGQTGQNYSHFQKLAPVFKHQRIAAFEVYTTGGDGFGVCGPLRQDGKLLGSLCLGFDADILRERYGVSKKQFLGLDFNAP